MHHPATGEREERGDDRERAGEALLGVDAGGAHRAIRHRCGRRRETGIAPVEDKEWWCE
jgi:hypothetical protein